MKIEVKVKSNSGCQEINELSEGKYEVKLKSPPENNKANLELLKLLKKKFKKDFKIILGIKSKNKVLFSKD